jgi:hypothetical protein
MMFLFRLLKMLIMQRPEFLSVWWISLMTQVGHVIFEFDTVNSVERHGTSDNHFQEP